ncbi:MAG: hypothetical protein ACK5LS_03375 [Propioniciclava sp.]
MKLRPRKRLLLGLLLITFAAAAPLAAVAAFQALSPIVLPHGVTVSFGHGAGSILRELTPDETLWRATDAIETRAGDGASPQMADQHYELAAPAAALREALSAACDDAGFAPPQTPERLGESDLICTGERQSELVSVFLLVECEEPGCRAGLWVHVY